MTLFDFKKQNAAHLHTQGQARSAEGDRDGAIAAYLQALATEGGHVMEEWTVNVRNLCKQCSEGSPHDALDAALPSERQAQRELGVAVGANAPTDAATVFARSQDRTGARLRSSDIVPRHHGAH